MFNLSDKIIIITGGCGNLGKEFSQALLKAQARVLTVDLSAQGLEKFSSEFSTNNYHHVQGDVTSRADMEKALRAVHSLWNDAPFGLINNAALDSPPNASAQENGPFEEYPEHSWDKVMSVNTKGTFIPCQVFGGAMAQAGRGSIINIGSIYGLVSPDQRVYQYRAQDGAEFYKPVAYSASKSALLNLSRYLATYWGPKGVRVNTVTFGGVFNGQDEKFLQEYSARVPLGRMAQPNEYNGVILFLMSEAASYMTGSNMVVDGGWTAW